MREDFPDWHAHEDYVAELLGIDKTVSSGNKFYDISDAVSREHVLENRVQFMADAKSTRNKTFRIGRDFLKDYREASIIRGKIFLLPIRFEVKGTGEVHDWILLHANDFSELLGLEIKNESVARAKYLDEKAQEISSNLSKTSELLYEILEDKSVPQSSKKRIVESLDYIDDVVMYLVRKEDRR